MVKVWGVTELEGRRSRSPRTGSDGLFEKQALPWCLMQWRPLHYKSLLKSHAAFHVYREHMEKPAIFRPQNKPLCSWTHDRTGSFLPREPHPRGVGPLTVIKPPQFSQQNRSYIKLKYRGLINKAWAGEKRMEWRTATIIFRLFSPHGHGQCKAMRYISKHEADVYLDKEEKKTGPWKGPRLRRRLQMSRLHWSQFLFLHNAMGWSYICFSFLYSS